MFDPKWDAVIRVRRSSAVVHSILISAEQVVWTFCGRRPQWGKSSQNLWGMV